MKPDEIIVRFRQPQPGDPVNNLWQNSGEVHRFPSFKAAWKFIRGCYVMHPLLGNYLSKKDLEKTVRCHQLEDTGVYFFDVFGKDEKKARDTFYKQIRSNKWQQQ